MHAGVCAPHECGGVLHEKRAVTTRHPSPLAANTVGGICRPSTFATGRCCRRHLWGVTNRWLVLATPQLPTVPWQSAGDHHAPPASGGTWHSCTSFLPILSRELMQPLGVKKTNYFFTQAEPCLILPSDSQLSVFIPPGLIFLSVTDSWNRSLTISQAVGVGELRDSLK